MPQSPSAVTALPALIGDVDAFLDVFATDDLSRAQAVLQLLPQPSFWASACAVVDGHADQLIAFTSGMCASVASSDESFGSIFSGVESHVLRVNVTALQARR